MQSDTGTIQIVIEPLAVPVEVAAAMFGMSRSHWLALEKLGAIGPKSIEGLGKRKLYITEELKKWAAASMPRRCEWVDREQE